MIWKKFKEELMSQGLYESFANPADGDIVVNTECKCGYDSLHPVAFRGRGYYLVCGVCLCCGNYVEVKKEQH